MADEIIPVQSNITPEEARRLLWQQGVLHWILRPVQQELYNSHKHSQDEIVVWLAARRLGKSFSLCTIAIETCLKIPNAIVKYCCAKQKDAKNITREVIRPILESCPLDLRPVFKTQENIWQFPNGSMIQLTGLDGGRAESIRGGSAHLAIIDEAGLVDDLEDIILSIIRPTLITTKGKIILASTPPKSPGHDFIKIYVNSARIKGTLVTKTIFDNKEISQQELQNLIQSYGGMDSIYFRREFLCEIIKDENRAIVPEFNASLKAKIIQEWPRTPFYDAYVAMDIGMKDLTVVLFAWYDFRESKLIIEDEFVINGQKFNTNTLAEGIKRKEAENFTDKVTGEQKVPYQRISDNNLIVIQDLYTLHGLRFFPTRKDDADAALNKVRIMLQNEEIIINPRCKTLINHLETGIWNKARTSFDRSGDTGHFDAIDSLKYLVRNINTTHNPYPSGFFSKPLDFNYNTPKNYSKQNEFGKIFNLKSSRTDQEKTKQLIAILTPKKRI